MKILLTLLLMIGLVSVFSPVYADEETKDQRDKSAENSAANSESDSRATDEKSPAYPENWKNDAGANKDIWTNGSGSRETKTINTCIECTSGGLGGRSFTPGNFTNSCAPGSDPCYCIAPTSACSSSRYENLQRVIKANQ